MSSSDLTTIRIANTTQLLVLDFSDLLPTQQQIDSFNSLSTGNTPTHSPSNSNTADSDSGAYSPPMSSSLLPGAQPPSSAGLNLLTNWLDTLFTGIDFTRKLRPQDYNAWKSFLSSRNFSHEDYRSALLHAADKVVKAERTLADLQPEKGCEGLIGYQAGILTGMTLETVRWEDVTGERMSTTEVRSGILQAVASLFAVMGRISAVRAEKTEEYSGVEGDGDVEMAGMGRMNPDEIVLE